MDSSKTHDPNPVSYLQLVTSQAEEQAELYGIGFVYEDPFGQLYSLDPRKVRVIRRLEDGEYEDNKAVNDE